MTRGQRWLLIVIVAGLFFLCTEAFAQSADSCEENPVTHQWHKYRINGQSYNGGVATGYIYASKAQACAANESGFCSWSPASGSCDAGSTPWHAHSTFNNVSCQTEDGFTAGSIARQVVVNPPVDCPADELECEMPANPETGLANFWEYPGDPGPTSACDVASHCLTEMRPGTVTCGPTTCGAIYDWHDSACDGETVPEDDTPPPLADPEAPAPAERCYTIGEAEYCVNTGDPPGNDAQCGFLNDRFICVDATPQNGCQSVGSDGVLCDPAAETPPAPDNGTPGTVADPDGEVVASPHNGTSTNTYNYYNNDTIDNSSTGVTTGHVDRGNDQDGDGFTDENEEEGPTGTASGGLSCASEPACEGDQIQCAILAQEWRARCPEEISEADMMEAVGATPEEIEGFAAASGDQEVDVNDLSSAGFLGSASCPAPLNVTIMGVALNMNLWQGACSAAEWFAPFVMAMGYLLGAYLFVGKSGV